VSVIGRLLIKKPRTPRMCSCCGRPMAAGVPQLRLYGAAEPGDRPYTIYTHVQCPREIGQSDPVADAEREKIHKRMVRRFKRGQP